MRLVHIENGSRIDPHWAPTVTPDELDAANERLDTLMPHFPWRWAWPDDPPDNDHHS
jgi:hypothetical protein